MGITRPTASRKVQPAPSTGTTRAGVGTQGAARAGVGTQGAARAGVRTQPRKDGKAAIQIDKKQEQEQSRDPRAINEHVKVQFEDVLGEPGGVRTIDCCWIKSWSCYTCCKNVIYTCVSFLCGFPLATIYGCMFACTAFPHVWIITPFSKTFQICCHSFSRLFKLCIYCLIGGPCENCGELFSAFNTRGKKAPVTVGKRGGNVTFNDKIKTRKIPARNAVGAKEQPLNKLQIVRR